MVCTWFVTNAVTLKGLYMMTTSEETDYIALAKQADVWTEKDFMFADVLNSKIKAFAKLIDAKATAREREACAKICDELSTKHTWEGCYANECAEAIRARGNT
jgi:hypothetical protein